MRCDELLGKAGGAFVLTELCEAYGGENHYVKFFNKLTRTKVQKTLSMMTITGMITILAACNQVAGCTNDAPHSTPKTAVVQTIPSNNNHSDNATQEHYEYFVSGTNLHTNERVVGWLTAKPGAATVRGVIYDRADRWTVLGQFSGKGQFHLTSLTSTYSVSVVPEVSGDKRLNAKLAK